MTKRHFGLLAATLALLGTAGCGSEGYPLADPVATATRLDGYTQTAYDALGLTGAALDDAWPGGGLEAEGWNCYSRDLGDQLSDSPPSEPGVVRVSDEWAVKGVSHARAVAALRRARGELAARGWKVTDFDDTPQRLRLRLKPPGSDDKVSVEEYPGGRLQVGAYADCARYPEGTALDAQGDPEVPEQRAPVQLRGE
ncbi:hypothetical protein [Streptomyces griseosporeus]|uniref:hypothetical protein n=1 Tax=Streptomyces griseosporeus TaxID=1910 RepID=UPI0036FAD738